MKKSVNEVVKSASLPIAAGCAIVAAGCSSTWSAAEEGLATLVTAIISFASSALGIVFVWVLANLKTWLDAWKKKHDAKESEVATKEQNSDNKK